MSNEAINNEFLTFVKRVFSAWSSLQIAVDHHSGGDETKEKYEWLATVVAEHVITTKGLKSEDLEEWLQTVLYNDFDLILEDDSIYSTSFLLIEGYGYIKNNDVTRYNQLLSGLPTPEVVNKVKSETQQIAENSDDEMDLDENDEQVETVVEEPRVRQPKTVTDDDGWTTVLRRGFVGSAIGLKDNKDVLKS